jgi:hypothetical protein
MWEKDQWEKDQEADVYIRLRQRSDKMVDLMLCDSEGEFLRQGIIATIFKGKLHVHSRLCDCGLKTSKSNRIKIVKD